MCNLLNDNVNTTLQVIFEHCDHLEEIEKWSERPIDELF